jgi:hypothetical protein
LSYSGLPPAFLRGGRPFFLRRARRLIRPAPEIHYRLPAVSRRIPLYLQPAEVRDAMNRYTLMFAALLAASFTVHPSGGGGTDKKPSDKEKEVQVGRPGPELSDPVGIIQAFLKQTQPEQPGAPEHPRILFAMVPHPTETHLAEAFDHNVDALQDGLQAAGYLFDSSWIPWKFHQPRDQFDDETKEETARLRENEFPGVLLFRRNRPNQDPYHEGVVVFLIGERPVGGIYRSEVQKAIEIIDKSGISLSEEIRILGPTYSGSLPSLAPVVEDLLGADKQAQSVFIRSGSFSGCGAAYRTLRLLNGLPRKVKIDLGSTNHDSSQRIAFVRSEMGRIGIDPEHIAILTEGETLYGEAYRSAVRVENLVDATKANPELEKNKGIQVDEKEDSLCQKNLEISGMWSIPFPRDISSLRAGYENQGLFDSYSPEQPWKRYLNLKNEEQGEGDSVHKFGGTATVAAQESVMFGISEFLKKHDILAAMILASNEQDRYFLTQFLHANNSRVRVVVLDPTRIFLRGSTSQFRGDLFVGEFPLLPWLHDWTVGRDVMAGHIFADHTSQGIFYASIDLFADKAQPLRWYSEYSEPDWTGTNPVLRPPMYLVALGGNATWPIAEQTPNPVSSTSTDPWQMAMPFVLFSHSLAEKSVPFLPTPPLAATTLLTVRGIWKFLFFFLAGLVVAVCIFFWCANPAARSLFSSFDPSRAARFWIFKVAIPGAVAGCAFRVMAWSVAIPASASSNAVVWWRWAEAFTVLAPLVIAISAVAKAMGPNTLPWNWRMLFPAIPPAVALLAIVAPSAFGGDRFSPDIGATLNTFREMHWESGLSLVPTAMLFLAAILIWSCQASYGSALLDAAPPLPDIPRNLRISDEQAKKIAAIGRPIPITWRAKWLWVAWFFAAMAIVLGQFRFRPFRQITTLETKSVTQLVFVVSATITILIVLDLLQFFWLWVEFRTLLHTLHRHDFKRSFVPITDFDWRSLWTFTGVSFQGRRAINSSHIEALVELARKHGLTQFEPYAAKLERMRIYYDVVEPDSVARRKFVVSRRLFFCILNEVGKQIMVLLDDPKRVPVHEAAAPKEPQPPCVLVCNCKEEAGHYQNEVEELTKIPAWQRAAERFICLMYIGFIQAIVARLHTQLISISAGFSLMVLGIAIYPFQPLSPLMLAGLVLLVVIAVTFYKVFKEMDTDPILSRIVNGDDRKLQGNFYAKYAESMALPLLTLASSLLPGGASRLLELAQTFFNQSQ